MQLDETRKGGGVEDGDVGGPPSYPTQDPNSCVRGDPIESHHLEVLIYIFIPVRRSPSFVVLGRSSGVG